MKGVEVRLRCLPAIFFDVLQDLRSEKIYSAPLFVAWKAPVHPVMKGNKGNTENGRHFFAA
jgi:hypothetical protein